MHTLMSNRKLQLWPSSPRHTLRCFLCYSYASLLAFACFLLAGGRGPVLMLCGLVGMLGHLGAFGLPRTPMHKLK